jgi:dUTP pyrophosphatase
MEKLEIKVKKLDPRAVLPVRGSEFAAGADLCACTDDDIVIAPGETVFIHTGLTAEIPEGYADSDYRGEYMVALLNHSAQPVTVTHGQRIAQLVVMPVMFTSFVEVDELSETQRGSGGFGSTGK